MRIVAGIFFVNEYANKMYVGSHLSFVATCGFEQCRFGNFDSHFRSRCRLLGFHNCVPGCLQSVSQQVNGPPADYRSYRGGNSREPLGSRIPPDALDILRSVVWGLFIIPACFFGARYSRRHLNNGWRFYGGLVGAVACWCLIGVLLASIG